MRPRGISKSPLRNRLDLRAFALLALISLLIVGQSQALGYAVPSDSSLVILSDSSSDPSDPGDPADPSDPGSPSNPADPSNPSDPGDPSDPSDPTDPSDPPDTTEEYVTRLFIQDDTPDADGTRHYIGEGEPGYENISITSKGRQVQLNSWYTTNLAYGAIHETANSEQGLGGFTVDWQSSDNSIATISPTGLITPYANGRVFITVSVQDSSLYQGDSSPVKVIEVICDGQEGEYVTKVTIIGEDGVGMGTDAGTVKLITDESPVSYRFFVQVTWSDSDGTIVRVEDTRLGDTVTSSVVWSITGNPSAGTINADTGQLRTTGYSGNLLVICDVTGGLGGKTLRDIAPVQVDTGVYEYDPQESLTLRVVYQEFPEIVIVEQTYSFAELLGMLPTTSSPYTVLGNNTYGVINARGFLFKDVIGLAGVDLADVYRFVFGTPDNHDAPVSHQLLYGSGARYYFPNWDIGSKAESVVVPPMLAYESSMVWGQSEVDPSLSLDEGTRFRLCYGPTWEGNSNSYYQTYWIHTITIELTGAPPANPDLGDGEGDGEGPGENKGGGGTGNDGIGGGGTAGGADGDDAPNASDGTAPNDAKTPDGEGLEDILSALDTSGGGYRVYEMIKPMNSQVPALVLDSPLLPYAGPIALGNLMAGFAITYWGFRRRQA
jgi:hypothetical protein